MNVIINLLPDHRLAKQREAHRRHLFTGLAALVVVICVGAVVAGMLFVGSQKLLIANADRQIKDRTDKLQKTEGLTEALTAQQHLAALPGLYEQRVYLSKFFAAYTVAAPEKLALEKLSLTEQNVLSIAGLSDTYFSVAKLARAMEAVNVTIGPDAKEGNSPYFTNVKITTASRGTTGIEFKITAQVATGVTDGN